jgi:hypothetical protein
MTYVIIGALLILVRLQHIERKDLEKAFDEQMKINFKLKQKENEK